MHEDSIKYTSFVTPNGQYEYNKMPFGLKNAPAFFQRFICTIFKDLLQSGKVVIYIDDITIATADFESHIQILSEVLDRLHKCGLELNLNKCKFGFLEISPQHIEAIQNFPEPKTFKELERCYGLFSYFRKFVKSFSTISKPLTNLMKKNAKFVFDSECIKSFNLLKELLITSPILGIYNPIKETELHTDASSIGFGAILLQKQEDGKMHPISYFSRTTTDTESKLHSFELETLAIVYALERFESQLKGIPFTIVTDCNALALAIKKKKVNQRIAKWVFNFENFDYQIKHRSGVSMPHVDALSRCFAIEDVYNVDFNIQVAQNRDVLITDLRDKLEFGPVDNFELKDGLVFKNDGSCFQLYVPSEMENNIIRLIHEKIGHMGVDKTVNQIKNNYFFPKLRQKVNNYIKNCTTCIFYSPGDKSNTRNLFPIPKIPIPFDTIHIDHFKPTNSCSIRSVRKYILVIVDAFTKHVKLFAVKNTSTNEICCSLQKYFDNYSRPRRIISDRASCFTSTNFKNFIEHNNIKHVLVATGSPQANGQVERVNRVLKTILSKITNPLNHSDWVNKLTDVEFAINNSVNCSTRKTPYMLLFGVEQRGRNIDHLTEYLEEKFPRKEQNLEVNRLDAAENIEDMQNKNQKYFLKHNIPAKVYNIGDYVVVKIEPKDKLSEKFKGPYIIHKILPHDRYVIKDIDGLQITQIPYDGVVEASRLKMWICNDGLRSN